MAHDDRVSRGPRRSTELDSGRAADVLQHDGLDSLSFASDQACKECYRRKAKCDRMLPTCGPCSKYSRHCLYEKHSKTPLTRKHLTDVEERLERAERILKRVRQNTVLGADVTSDMPDYQWPSPHRSPELVEQTTPLDQTRHFGPAPEYSSSTVAGQPLRDSLFHTPSQDISNSSTRPSSIVGASNLSRDEEHSSQTLDEPPTVSDHFEWTEHHVVKVRGNDLGASPDYSNTSEEAETEAGVMDGMASLTINKSDGGYLGPASGAALLRLIDSSATNGLVPLGKTSSLRPLRALSSETRFPDTLYDQPDPNKHIVDTMIDAYFRLYNVSYPIVHEPTFRAQYSEIIERPNGNCWRFLAYVIAAIGVYTTSSTADNSDLPLLAQAKNLMHLSYLESGNLTLLQALALMSNYLQKKDMPNSGYNYMGLATRMAVGLGLHKEFQGWNIQPLRREMRRRVWWCLSVFDVGATITFGRPLLWPEGATDIAYPLNTHDRQLTAASKTYPPEADEITLYTSLRALSSFYGAAIPIYSKIISKPLSSAQELMDLDDRAIGSWYNSLPSYFNEYVQVPSKYRTSHAIVMWKYKNFRIIMYRPFVIRKLLLHQKENQKQSPSESKAFDRCLYEARSTIHSIHSYWTHEPHAMFGAWYALYFLFQAALIPCICLRNDRSSPSTGEWLHQIHMTMDVLKSMSSINPTSERCYDVISTLCQPYLRQDSSTSTILEASPTNLGESPNTQMNGVYSMMWSHFPTTMDGDLNMQDDAWMAFLADEDQGAGLTI